MLDGCNLVAWGKPAKIALTDCHAWCWSRNLGHRRRRQPVGWATSGPGFCVRTAAHDAKETSQREADRARSSLASPARCSGIRRGRSRCRPARGIARRAGSGGSSWARRDASRPSAPSAGSGFPAGWDRSSRLAAPRGLGGMQHVVTLRHRELGAYQSVVHSHTLPIMS